MEKLKLSLSKQHNKTLKIKFEMLKMKKNVKIIKLENFHAKLSGILEKFFENFLFPG